MVKKPHYGTMITVKPPAFARPPPPSGLTLIGALYKHGVFDDFPKISDHLPKISEDFAKLFRIPDERYRTFSENFRKFPKMSENCRKLPKTSEEDPKMFRLYTNDTHTHTHKGDIRKIRHSGLG